MKKRPPSPYTFLQEFNKRAVHEDGQVKATQGCHWSQKIQQMTPFIMPKHFEQQHKDRKSEMHTESIYQMMRHSKSQPAALQPAMKLPNRKLFSVTKFQMQSIQSDVISQGTFDRKNMLLNRILSQLSEDKLNVIYQKKTENILNLVRRKPENKLQSLIMPKVGASYARLSTVIGEVNLALQQKHRSPNRRYKTLV